MPLYPYTCDACGCEFEKVVPATAGRESVTCPECESGKVTRGFGLPAAGVSVPTATNCRGDGPPCGAPGCGRMRGR